MSTRPVVVPVWSHIGDESELVAHCGQATAVPELVIVPEFDHGRFTGGFVVAHVPTCRILPPRDLTGRITPTLAAEAARTLTHLDWSSTDHADYQDEHREAWLDALARITDFLALVGGAR